MDFNALYRKLALGDKSADVLPGINFGTIAGTSNQQDNYRSTRMIGDALNRQQAKKDAQGTIPVADSPGRVESAAVGTGTGAGLGGGLAAPAPAVDPDAAIRQQLRDEIAARGGDIEGVYKTLFGELENLLKARDSELESQYGEQLEKAGEQYTSALPELENSYAALGAGDSTDQSDAKTGAKEGFEETTETIGKNKQADKAKLGQYGKEQRAKITADKEAAARNVGRAGETEDVGALRDMRNQLENNISQAGVTKATLGTDGSARQELSQLTADNGRFGAATNALDNIIKSSMSGAVKEAAVKAVVDNAGLSDEEKQKVQQQYGNVYAEQSAL